ncbi:hypothetical protein K4K56_008950 [Colletotrichum sp. SAR 10_98]|nr:hypothetical protein K4K56_008950 [Colletotrichum sp. SAR 10_98]
MNTTIINPSSPSTELLKQYLSLTTHPSPSSAPLTHEYQTDDAPNTDAAPEIGEGCCATTYALPPSSIAKVAKPNKQNELWNDFGAHLSVYEAISAINTATMVPKPAYYLHAQDITTWRPVQAKKIPSREPNDVLCAERIPPLPRVIRRSLVDVFCPKEQTAEVLENKKNDACLVRLYLGRRRPSSLHTQGTFSLRNFELTLDKMELLDLDAMQSVAPIAEALAVVHWQAGSDGRDIEFVLGGPPERRISAEGFRVLDGNVHTQRVTMWRKAGTVDRVAGLQQRSVCVWLLDFNQCSRIKADAQGVQMAADAYWDNDPYYPRPIKDGDNDSTEGQIWREFKRVYLTKAALKGFVLPLFYGARRKMLEKRNSADGGGGDTDRDMVVASATAAAPAKEAFSPQDPALNSPRDGSADEKTERVPDGDIGTTSPSSSSDCGSQRVGDEKGRKGVWDLAVRVLTWTPKKLRYDPNNPPQFSLAHNFLYAVAATFTVAVLYYNQPVLNKIAETFDISFERASSVATLMQAGYAAGLLFICPLGDMVRRRPFILILIWVTAMLWLGLCVTNSFAVFSALSFLVGVTTVTPQLMLPLVADMAPANRKASSLSIVTSGLMLGMLIARLLSGIVANFTSWRNIYWFAFGTQYLLLILLFFFMPDYPSTNPDGLNYFKALWTIVTMFFSSPILVHACLIGFCISSIFTSFWTTLTFLLASPPYEYPSLTIGLFSLIGIAAICGGPVYGRLIMDRYVPFMSSVLGQTVILIGCLVGAFTSTITVAGPVIQAICIDIGIQTAQTANRTAIYTINPKARNRVNTAYMVSVFCGQLTGTAVGNRLYAQGGWRYSGGATNEERPP